MIRHVRRFGPAALVLLVGAACLLYGAARGEAAVVVQKATLICLECIGIG